MKRYRVVITPLAEDNIRKAHDLVLQFDRL